MSNANLRGALQLCALAGATAASARLEQNREQRVLLVDGRFEVCDEERVVTQVQVTVNGANGSASGTDGQGLAMDALAQTAIEVARANAALNSTLGEDPVLPLADRVKGDWKSEQGEDPFLVGLDPKLELLRGIERTLRSQPDVCASRVELRTQQRSETHQTQSRVDVEQTWRRVAVSMSATACAGEVRATRRSPGFAWLGGWEQTQTVPLHAEAQRIATEASQLLTADPSPQGTFPVVLAPHTLAVVLHETFGHIFETGEGDLPDAGRRVASGRINIVSDPTDGRRVGSYGFDAAGFGTERRLLVQEGMMVTPLTGEDGSGAWRSSSPSQPPALRMSNVDIPVGDSSLGQLLAQAEGGLLLDGASRWWLDGQRRNFWVEAEIGWWIEGGGPVRAVNRPAFGGDTYEFWRSCHDLGLESWEIPFNYCSKRAGTGLLRPVPISHSVPHGLFVDVKVGPRAE
ncbi:MAG: hypothetical protein AUK47_19255 [Deltaproteobacteria bacterium CG2_30_63_29]|nr:MAG: hypothetical protein AUK47_19255 [Deltaproteobacteria bacterium CG2_30_63_29]PJB38974.1 MAG: hypothetical protein CO108_18210 [Deltaproteobacteria bacterium CG_4_9_14_3_um_filter_63_12]